MIKRFNYIIIIVIVLFSLGLFYIKYISLPGIRVLETTSLILILGLFIVYGLYSEVKIPIKRNFTTPVLLILAGVLLSSLSCYIINGQSLKETLFFQRYFYAIIFYFLLFYFVPKPEFIFKLILYLALFNGLLYLAQYFLYPTQITLSKVFLQRGTIRINLPGSEYRHFAYFMCIYRFFTKNDKKSGLYALFFLIVALLSGYRSVLAMYMVLTMAYLLVGKRLKNRFLMISGIVIILISVFFAFQSMLIEMKESAEKESAQGTEYVRFKAAEYFLKEKMKEPLTLILGNGLPGENSAYARSISMISLRYGYYLSDIGILGYYFQFGLITTLTVLILLLSLIFRKLHKDLIFLKLYFIFKLALMFNTGIVFDRLYGMVFGAIVLYLIDYKQAEMKGEIITTEENSNS